VRGVVREVPVRRLLIGAEGGTMQEVSMSAVLVDISTFESEVAGSTCCRCHRRTVLEDLSSLAAISPM